LLAQAGVVSHAKVGIVMRRVRVLFAGFREASSSESEPEPEVSRTLVMMVLSRSLALSSAASAFSGSVAWDIA
jgi:hypothetical protein